MDYHIQDEKSPSAEQHSTFHWTCRRDLLFNRELLGSVLGYANRNYTFREYLAVVHPQEREKLNFLNHQLSQAIRRNRHFLEKCFLHTTNRFRQSGGDYRCILQMIKLKACADDQYEVQSTCVDISRIGTDQYRMLQLIPTENNAREMVRAVFNDFFDQQRFHFSHRELQVLKTWSESASAKAAAERLQLSTRTIESHLKNMRKRLGVNRSMDVLLYAKANNLI